MKTYHASRRGKGRNGSDSEGGNDGGDLHGDLGYYLTEMRCYTEKDPEMA